MNLFKLRPKPGGCRLDWVCVRRSELSGSGNLWRPDDDRSIPSWFDLWNRGSSNLQQLAEVDPVPRVDN